MSARDAPRTARLLVDSPRRPLPACYLAKAGRLYDVGCAPAELAAAAAAAAVPAGDVAACFAAREAAKAAVVALKRLRLACAAGRVASCLCRARDAEVAFWVSGPARPLFREKWPGPHGKPISLVSRLRPPR